MTVGRPPRAGGQTAPAERIFVFCDGDLGASAGRLGPLAEAVESGRCDLAVAAFARRRGAGSASRWASRAARSARSRASSCGRRSRASARCAARRSRGCCRSRRVRRRDRDDGRRRARRPAAGGGRARPRAPRHRSQRGRASCTAAASSRTSCACTCRALRRGRRIGSRRSPVILAIDQGTTGTTCLRVRRRRPAARARLPRVHAALPAAGLGRARRVRDLGRDARGRARGARSPPASRPARCAPSGSRTSARPSWHGTSARGEPLHHAIVWQDRRTAARCDELREQGLEELVRERTGLVIDPYFSGTKIEWMLEHVDGLRERGRRGRRALRDDRRVACVQAHRPRGDRLLERVADDAVRHPRAALGRGAVRRARRAGRGAAGGGSLRASVLGETDPDAFLGARVPVAGHGGRPAGGAVRPGLPASRASARTPTAPAASCCRTPGRSPPPVRAGLLTHRRVGDRRPRRLRARGERVRDRRRGAVAARRPRHHLARPPRPRRWRRRSTPTTASTSCPR